MQPKLSPAKCERVTVYNDALSSPNGACQKQGQAADFLHTLGEVFLNASEKEISANTAPPGETVQLPEVKVESAPSIDVASWPPPELPPMKARLEGEFM